MVRAEVEATDSDVLEAIEEEHHIVKWELSELQGMPAEAESFNAQVTVLIETSVTTSKKKNPTSFPGCVAHSAVPGSGSAVTPWRCQGRPRRRRRIPARAALRPAPIAKVVDKLLDR